MGFKKLDAPVEQRFARKARPLFLSAVWEKEKN